MEFEKLLGVEESIRRLIIQVVNEPFLEVLKEKYIRYGGQTPFEMIEHLRAKISKVTNNYKVQLRKQVFIEWEQLQVLTAFSKQNDKAHKQLAK